MNTCEYLARIGFLLLNNEPTPCEDDTEDDLLRNHLEDHQKIRQILLTPARPFQDKDGARWITPITWPDRLPDLKTWSGRQTLPGIIAKLQEEVRKSEQVNLFEMASFMHGASGFNGIACQDSLDSLDIGFSPAALGIAVRQYPARELLAILALETLPLVSFGRRHVGFIHDGQIWQFKVEPRDSGYYYRWGEIKSYESETVQ